MRPSKLVQAPMVSGWLGFASRAQRNAAAASGKLFSPIRELPGSLYRSQISTRRSLPNRPTRSLMYRSRSGHAARSTTRFKPGLGTQPLLCTPGTGSSCLPR